MDGFDEDEAESKGDKGAIVLGCLLAAERKALEALELAHGLLDARTPPVEGSRKELRPVPGIALEGNDRAKAARARGLTMRLGVVALIAHSRTRSDVGPEIEQDLELRAVACLAFWQMESEGQALVIELEVDLGREAASGATKRLSFLPPLAPAAETCAGTVVEANIWTR